MHMSYSKINMHVLFLWQVKQEQKMELDQGFSLSERWWACYFKHVPGYNKQY